MMTAVVLTLAVGSLPPLPRPSLMRRAESFTEADCRRNEGHRVSFSGRVLDVDGVDGLYRVVLVSTDPDRPARPVRQWQAMLPRGDWLRYNRGDLATVSGMLTLHDVDGDYFATVHVTERVPADDSILPATWRSAVPAPVIACGVSRPIT